MKQSQSFTSIRRNNINIRKKFTKLGFQKRIAPTFYNLCHLHKVFYIIQAIFKYTGSFCPQQIFEVAFFSAAEAEAQQFSDLDKLTCSEQGLTSQIPGSQQILIIKAIKCLSPFYIALTEFQRFGSFSTIHVYLDHGCKSWKVQPRGAKSLESCFAVW